MIECVIFLMIAFVGFTMHLSIVPLREKRATKITNSSNPKKTYN